jgi:hypothetical protein
MSDLLKRIGTFKITRNLIEKNPEAIVEILKDVLVVSVENDFPTNTLIYKGYSKHFDLIEVNESLPQYIVEVDTVGEPYLVTWHRQKEYSEKDVKTILEEINNQFKKVLIMP